jgi:tetratricopeptide (TPR) repeat protein
LKPSRWWQHDLRAAVLVATVALLARGLHVWLGSRGPFMSEPLIDSLTYHDLARDLAAGGPITDRLLWQAPFYPLVLSLLYALTGPSVLAARLMGVVVGTVTALVSWRLGWRVLGPGGGLIVGLVAALHGVLVAFDTEMLATGWATLWLVGGAWLLVELNRGGRAGLLGAAFGLIVALALITRTVVAPALLVGFGWTLWRVAWPRRRRLVALGGAVVAAVVVLGPFAAVMHQHAGHLGLWPPSGAINVHIGNNADIDATLSIRPGLAWERLIAEPVRETGIDDPWVSAGWFAERTRDFAAHDPARFLANLGRKTLHLLSTRELPRNIDIMVHREWSPVLSVLLWRVGPWGFPTGLLLPLAMVGLLLAWRRLPGALVLVALAYAVSLVLVFTSARYRAPLWPLASVVAVAGAMELARCWRWGAWRRLGACVVVAAALLLGTIPGPFAQEQLDLRPEMWHGVGFNQLQRGELPAAEASFRRALGLRDDYPEAWNRLGVALARQDRDEESIACFARALELAPDYPDPPPNLELARQRASRRVFEAGHRHQQADEEVEAAACFERVLELTPGWAEPRARLALILATTAVDSLRDATRAVELARRALADHGGDHPWLSEVLEAAEAAAAER